MLGAAALGVMAVFSPAWAAELTLTREGRPAATIVLAAEPTKAAQFAAHELQYHIKLITGAELPIRADDAPADAVRILVGESAATRALGLTSESFLPEEYLIRFLPDALVLIGRDKDDRGRVVYDDSDYEAFRTWPDFFEDHATCFAVYDFLERFCGVRWYFPHEFGTVYPVRPTLTVSGEEIRRRPTFIYRQPSYGLGMSEWFDREIGLWPTDSDEAKAIDGEAFEQTHRRWPDRWPYIHAKRAAVRLYMHRLRMGGQRYAANHSFYGYYDRFWEPNPERPELFEARHPDWFAQGYEGKPPQMCYTNPDFIAQVIQDARDYFDGKGTKPGAVAFGDFFALVPMDNGAYCKCPRCQAKFNQAEATNPHFSNGRWSDYIFGFVNEVAREIRKTHPDKYLAALAYADYAYYPANIRLEPNIAVQLCLHVRNWWSPIMEANDRRIFESWVTKEKGRPIYLWLYYTFPQEIATGGGWHCFPGFFAHTAARQLAEFAQAGIKGIFCNGMPTDFDAYLVMRLFDDPTLNVDAVMDEFFTLYYGAAAQPMKRLYLAIEDAFSNPANYPDYVRTRPGHYHQTEELAWGYVGTEARMKLFADLMEQAEAAAQTDVERKRVRLFRREVWDYMVAGRRAYLEKMKAWAGSPPERMVLAISGPRPDGVLGKVNWRDTTALVGFKQHTGEPTRRKVVARAAHDGEWLYLRLSDKGAMSLTADDGWRVILAAQRGAPYRELIVGGARRTVAVAHDEAGNAGDWDSGAVVHSAFSPATGWDVTIALPLERLLPGGVWPGGSFFANIVRKGDEGGDEPMWAPTLDSPDDLSRLGKLTLEPLERAASAQAAVDEASLRRGLVGHWTFDEDSGDAALDVSGNGLHGKLDAGLQRVAGVRGGGLRFPGQQCVTVGNQPAVNLTGPLTLMAWVKPTGDVWYPAIMGKGYEANGAYSLHIRRDWSLWFELDDPDGKRWFYNPTDLTLEPGVWQHVAATYDGHTMRVYINGHEVGQGREGPAAIRQTAEPLRLGWLGSYGFFEGEMDEAAVYSRALSANEIRAEYLAGARLLMEP